MKPVPLLFALIACDPVSESDISPRLAPADGQTDVDASQALVLDGYALSFPADHPLPRFATVVELESGAPVEGTLEQTETGARFVPSTFWAPDTDYVLTISEPLEDSREPAFRLPVDDAGEPYAGAAVFSTRSQALPLALITSGDRFCVVASQPLLDVDLQRLTIERSGVRIAPTALEVLDNDSFELEPLPIGDSGLGVVCGAGDAVQRAWIGDAAVRSSGDRSLTEVVSDLRRFR